MIAYTPELWSDFFIATTGAAAALAGLMIVALSVSVKEIIRLPAIPAQAGATLSILALTLTSCILVLLPEQSAALLGIEILIFAIPGWLLQVWASRQFAKRRAGGLRPSGLIAVIIAGQVQVLPFIIGSISLLVHAGGGLYWIAGGTIIAFTLSLLSAWVWLIEVRR